MCRDCRGGRGGVAWGRAREAALAGTGGGEAEVEEGWLPHAVGAEGLRQPGRLPVLVTTGHHHHLRGRSPVRADL